MGNKVQSGKVAKKTPPAAKPSKPSSSKVSEIDDIFASPAPPSATPVAEKPAPLVKPKSSSTVKVIDATTAGKAEKQQRQPLPPQNDDFADSRGKNTKYTEDGLRVYFMDDLRIGEGEGDTESCPFDCQCCF
ncbi:hypothetical protein H4S02_006005 [Coemansia sp. RSA 2611]|nr:hypothetical protein H4S02_006005 [Coemansia sp. RSA 2611]